VGPLKKLGESELESLVSMVDGEKPGVDSRVVGKACWKERII